MMARLKFSRAASFWLLATVLAFMLFAASAPSPLYVVYQARWHFSSLTLTAIFGVYVLALLATLLITGRLSDHLGRRPVVLLAVVVQIVSMVAFIAARGVGMLFAARVLQGLGTGLATGALSAWLLDLQPPDNPRQGSLVASVAPVAGLAAGALVSGLLVQYGPDPLHLVFSLLCAVYALAFAAMPVIDDVAKRTPGWLQSRAAGGSLPVRRFGSLADRDVGPGRALSVAGTLAGPLLAQKRQLPRRRRGDCSIDGCRRCGRHPRPGGGCARDRDPCLARPSSGCWGHRACGSARLGRWPLRRQGAGRPRLRSGVLRSLPQPGTSGSAGQTRWAGCTHCGRPSCSPLLR